jgi:putative ABC transport system permease protein
MTSLLRDARFGLKLLRRTPAFTAVAVATLALGISTTTAIFSVVHGTFFAPLPYRQADRLVMLWERHGGDRREASVRNYLAWKRQAVPFADINAWSGRSVNIATNDRPENIPAGIATPGFLAMLGYGHPLALGRTFRDEEGIDGGHAVVILTYRFWKDRFSGDPGIIGRSVRVDDVPHSVVGVLGEGPADHQQNKIWLPLVLNERLAESDDRWLLVMARLKDDVEIPEANASMAALNATLEMRRGASNDARSVSVEPFRNNFVQDSTKRGIWLLLAAVMFLLLIACVNVANLLLARGSTRQRELAIRAAMGASRGAIARQLLVESVVLALAGGLLGAFMTTPIISAIVALMPEFTLPSETEIRLSIPVLLFALAMGVLSGVAAGLAPALQAPRNNVAEAMKEGGRTIGDRRTGLRRLLVVVEFALALTLLAGGGMAVDALMRRMNADLGFSAERLLTFAVPVPGGRLDSPERTVAFYEQLSERIAAVPGVDSVSVSTGQPIEGVRFGQFFEIVGKPTLDPRDRPGSGVNMVTPSYHVTYGIPIVRGRSFLPTDRAGGQPVAIVNQAFVKQFLAGVDPIGQRIRTFAAGPFTQPVVEWEIVGVQGNVLNTTPGRPVMTELVLPFAQQSWPHTVVAVRAFGEIASLQTSIAEVVQSIDPALPLANVRTMDEVLSRSVATDRFYTVFLAAFAAAALLLASVGIYGVMSFVVAQRTHEIGVRMALGGQRAQVIKRILREGMTTASIGTAIGAMGAVLIARALEGAIYGVEGSSLTTFVIVAVTLLTAAFVACLIPARRAASVDPMVALRQT